ncbi:Transcription factor BOA15 [Paramyrothecium foliicola]|nr:Transcription factor BOA15 [Paramyrothecium foliicola]
MQCVRLGKRCVYPAGRKPYGSSSHGSVSSDDIPSVTSLDSVSLGPYPQAAPNFPVAFFLDCDLFRPVTHSSLSTAAPVPQHISQLLAMGPDAICETYFGSIDTWFPFVSRKRLDQVIRNRNQSEAPGASLLLLCMRLITDNPLLNGDSPTESMFYRPARAYANVIEESAPASLHLFQALVLIALYELGHGIFPVAYLTVSRAARIGILRGVHDRKNSTQLLVTPPTYTIWEEERRTWWAASILERHMNLGPTGLPLAVPDPAQGDLLPAIDDEWRRGGIRANNPLFSSNISTDYELGPFARTCQASHTLGCVLQHRTAMRGTSDRAFVLVQAMQLATTLAALDQHLGWRMDDAEAPTSNEITTVDVAICTCARLALYHIYACNLPDATGERFSEESALQQASIDGIQQIINVRGAALARCVIEQCSANPERSSPLVVQALYDAATECLWFEREGGDVMDAATSTLQLLMQALALLAERWSVASKCLNLLRQSEEQ